MEKKQTINLSAGDLYGTVFKRKARVKLFSGQIQYLMSDKAWKKELQQLHKRFL